MRTQGLPYCLMAGNRITLSTQITSGFTLASTPGKSFLGPDRGLDDRLPAFLDVIVDLVVGALVEVGNVAVDEIRPVFRHFLRLHRLGHIDHMLLEAVARIDPAHARVGQEHRLVAQLLAGLGDAHRIQGRPESRFGKKCYNLAVAHFLPLLFVTGYCHVLAVSTSVLHEIRRHVARDLDMLSH